MVMSQESNDGMAGKISPVPVKEKENKERVSDREKELAGEASTAFVKGDYSGCLNSLEKLEILRPTDCTLAHNKIVTQCRATAGQQVPLSEVVQQLEGLANTLGLNLSGPRCEDSLDGSVLVYNLAVAKFQQRHILQAFQLASRLLPLPPSLPPSFSRKILFLYCELSLALHQPELALCQATKLEALLQSSQGFPNAEEQEAEAGRVLVLKARCQVMARQTRSLKKELKSVSLPGPLGQTCEFVRAHIEALHGNHKKSIKMLNSCVQAAGNRVFPHYYNNLGCLHQVMRKPNLAIYYFKNALDRLDGCQGGGEGVRVPGQDSSSWLTQSQVLYNIGVSLLHAKRASLAFDILVEVVGAHYLDPQVWFHLAECCLLAGQPDNSSHFSVSGGRGRQVSEGGVGAGLNHKLVTGKSSGPVPSPELGAATTPSLSLDFAYMCLKNAESLLPSSEQAATSGVFCEGVGYIGNPITWSEVENLRVAIITAKAYTALALGDYIPAGHYAEELLARDSCLPGGYKMLAHLYAAESLILQDKLAEALPHLDPDHVTSVEVGFPGGEGSHTSRLGPVWFPDSLESGKAAVQFNLAVGFALREEWIKASSITALLYREGTDVPVQVLLLVLYLSLRTGQVDKARRIVRDRCPANSNILDSGDRKSVV